MFAVVAIIILVLTIDMHVEALTHGRRYTIRGDTQITAHIGAMHIRQHEPLTLHRFDHCNEKKTNNW